MQKDRETVESSCGWAGRGQRGALPGDGSGVGVARSRESACVKDRGGRERCLEEEEVLRQRV